MTSPFRAYDPSGERPMAAYLALDVSFVTMLGVATAVLYKRLPRRRPGFILQALAVHVLARLATRSAVTSALRSPFTRFVRRSGGGEVEEETRGTGLQKAIGELVTCPYCITPSLTLGMAIAGLAAPRVTGAITRVMATVAVVHFLHQGYAALQKES